VPQVTKLHRQADQAGFFKLSQPKQAADRLIQVYWKNFLIF